MKKAILILTVLFLASIGSYANGFSKEISIKDHSVIKAIHKTFSNDQSVVKTTLDQSVIYSTLNKKEVFINGFILSCGYTVYTKTSGELSQNTLLMMSIAFENAFCPSNTQ